LVGEAQPNGGGVKHQMGSKVDRDKFDCPEGGKYNLSTPCPISKNQEASFLS